jgi:putative tryptophan/tyrosine transport system substrate-binding protein
MKRREFITLIGGAAAAWPLAARAQQAERMRRIGVLSTLPPNDPEGMARNAAFVQTLQELGWSEGRNITIDVRWGSGDAERIRSYVAELLALNPDVILATGVSSVGPLQSATRTVPIVFAQVADPVGAGVVESLARPGGNTTGFALYEYGTTAKWLGLIKEIAPGVTRVAVLRNQASQTGLSEFAAIQSAAPPLGIEVRPVGVRDAGEIERGITAIGQSSNAGLIATTGAYAVAHRQLLLALAARNRLPAIYPYRSLVSDGGLMCYAPDTIDPYRRAAGYVDRILRGEKPANLPVQAPVKFVLTINLKTAKALGLTVPDRLLATADEVIE